MKEDTCDIRFKSQGRNASYLNVHSKGMWRKVVFKIRGSINTWDQISKTVQSPWHFPLLGTPKTTGINFSLLSNES